MKRKFLSITMVMFAIVIAFTNVHAAEGLFSIGAYQDIYKLSEQAEIDLPFINIFGKSATYDKDIKHSGITLGQSTIDVDEKLEGLHVVFTQDMVNIKGEVENAVIYGNNVVIEGRVTGDTLILATNVQILDKAVIEKDVIIVSTNLDIKGTVNGNVIATIANKATVSGTIKSDLRVIANQIELEGSNINGEVYIETTSNATLLQENYPDATIKPIVQEQDQEIDVMGIITKGVITVVIYSVLCFLLTKKENNVVQKAYKKFTANTIYGLIMASILFMALLILPILLIILAIVGLGIIAWPILIVYIALLLFVATTFMLITGTVIFEIVKNKVGKFKIPAIALIYTVLFALAQITYISTYVNMAMFLFALSIIVTMTTKKMPSEQETKEE